MDAATGPITLSQSHSRSGILPLKPVHLPTGHVITEEESVASIRSWLFLRADAERAARFVVRCQGEFMSVVKAFVGLVAVCVGAVGIALSGFAIQYLWIGVQEFERQFPPVLDQVHATLDSLQEQGEATGNLLQGMRDHVGFISDAAEELANLSETRPAQSTLLENLEHDIHRRLEHTEEFVVSMQETLRTLGGALGLLDSIPFFTPRMSPESPHREPPLRAVSRALEEAADQLEQLSGIIARIRIEETLGPRQLAQVREILARVDSELQEVQGEIGRLAERVEGTRGQLAPLREQVPRWVQQAGLVLSVFFVCFGFSQFALVVWGLRPLLAG